MKNLLITPIVLALFASCSGDDGATLSSGTEFSDLDTLTFTHETLNLRGITDPGQFCEVGLAFQLCTVDGSCPEETDLNAEYNILIYPLEDGRTTDEFCTHKFEENEMHRPGTKYTFTGGMIRNFRDRHHRGIDLDELEIRIRTVEVDTIGGFTYDKASLRLDTFKRVAYSAGQLPTDKSISGLSFEYIREDFRK